MCLLFVAAFFLLTGCSMGRKCQPATLLRCSNAAVVAVAASTNSPVLLGPVHGPRKRTGHGNDLGTQRWHKLALDGVEEVVSQLHLCLCVHCLATVLERPASTQPMQTTPQVRCAYQPTNTASPFTMSALNCVHAVCERRRPALPISVHSCSLVAESTEITYTNS